VKGLVCIETHLAMHCGNGVRSRGGGLKRDETEATRAPRVLVHHHLGLSKAHNRRTTTDVKQARSEKPLYMLILCMAHLAGVRLLTSSTLLATAAAISASPAPAASCDTCTCFV
jgi:hypothetical protein